MTVVALRPNALTPALVLHHIHQELPNLKEIYVVGLTHEGEPISWSSGELGGLSLAALVLQDLALKYLNGEIIQDGPGDDPRREA